jgi:hypothetical protein
VDSLAGGRIEAFGVGLAAHVLAFVLGHPGPRTRIAPPAGAGRVVDGVTCEFVENPTLRTTPTCDE